MRILANMLFIDVDSDAPRPTDPAQEGQAARSPIAYREACRRIDQIDCLVRALDERREELGLSKPELAGRTELDADLVQRLFSVSGLNAPIGTLTAIADALDLELVARRRAS